ncbi:HNH endonuclease [Xylanimonas oleitrophica]|uniref:HNH endonuclease n=1 Tax=Xylanimonas oleitrophica TaxID=2607479 RepID=A0A2W5XSQ2_9MICO|nr:HNH endonuclease signature motif containing protein [Xylanimonas oleitrophica]PZR52938.1 HNH endonuclease [Xylanimonas oleitrophica]
MDSGAPQRAWLLMAAGDDRGHGGNAGYDDQVDAYYSWDSNVPNHRNITVGDPIALWDKERLLGVSVIEEIETTQGRKALHRCPKCRTTRIRERRRMVPRYRCMKCRHEFAAPLLDEVDVVLYRARYDAAWASLEGVLSGDEVRSLSANSGDFNAMRPLDWARFSDVLAARGGGRAVDRVSGRALGVDWRPLPGLRVEPPQGFRHSLVRVRRGQRQFREHLLNSQGSVCAFTGGAPERVLEAGHLYSYAELGTHFEHGGLMVRRDIHRLFDDGMLAVEPSKLRIDVAPDLAAYPQYGRLHGSVLAIRLRHQQIDWLGKHWDEHRGSSPGVGVGTGRQ